MRGSPSSAGALAPPADAPCDGGKIASTSASTSWHRRSRSRTSHSNSVDLLISTVNVPLDWGAMIDTLAPNGRLHVVGAAVEPIPVSALSLIIGQRSVSGSPAGSPSTIVGMLDFAARHGIAPQTEHFPMTNVDEAFTRLESGKARYRIVLDADF